MHEITVIFKKDVRRLWWQIAAMLAMCVVVGRLDAGRATQQLGVAEMLLNAVIPLVWACLIAEAVHGEALVGDREFWMTRPYRWRRLLGAKALFVLVVVHVPSFLIDAGVLAARGYNPLAPVQQLLVRQLLLACALTLPATALAALVSNLAKFVLGFPLLLTCLLTSAEFRRSPLSIFRLGGVSNLSIAVLAVAAVAVILLQYQRHQTRLAGILAGCALAEVIIAGPLTAYWQVPALARLAMPAADIHPTMTLAAPGPGAVHGLSGRRVSIRLPFKVTGLGRSITASMVSLSMEIAAANGVRYRYDPPRMDFDIQPIGIGGGSDSTSLFLGMQYAAYERIKESRVAISGTVGLMADEWGQEVRIPAGATREVGEGHCATAVEEIPNEGPWIVVSCDTPSPYGVLADIHMDFLAAVARTECRGDTELVSGGPFGWLSPLRRRQQWCRAGTPPDWSSREDLEKAPVIIVPQRVAGYSTISFKATDVDLREYTR